MWRDVTGDDTGTDLTGRRTKSGRFISRMVRYGTEDYSGKGRSGKGHINHLFRTNSESMTQGRPCNSWSTVGLLFLLSGP